MRTLLLELFLLFCLSVNAQYVIPKLDWMHTISGSNHGLGFGVALDNSGNVLITGYFKNTVDFESGPGVTNLSAVGGYDVFVSKYTNDGTFLWAKAMGGASYDYGYGIETDQNNNVLITGIFRGDGDFDPGPGVNTLTCGNSAYGNSFIVKLDSLGNHLWSKALTSDYAVNSYRVATDNMDNIYLAGRFDDTLDMDPGPGTATVISEGSADLYLIKFDPNGNYVNGIRQGGDTFDEASIILVDSSNNVYISGRYSDTVDFDPGPGTYTMIGQASYNAYIEKLDQNLNFQWVRTIESNSNSYGGGIAENQFGQLYFSGTFSGTADLNTAPGTYMATSNGSSDIFIIRLDSSGNFYWAKNFGGGSPDGTTGIHCDQNGYPYLVGSFVGSVDFDPGPGVEIHIAQGPTSGFHDLWVEKFDTLGNMQWVYTAGNATGINSGKDIVVDDSARIYMAGFNEGTIDWAPGAQEVLINSPGVDAYVHVLYQCEPGLSVDTVIACDYYLWIDANLYAADDSTSKFTILNGAANGCDSIITLNLKMNYSSFSTDVQSACSAYTWIDGNTYITNTNTPTWSTTNSVGCDSTVTLDLTILNNSTTDNVYACGSYSWIDGNVYTSSTNSPTWVLPNIYGCDSTITLNLTIGYPSSATHAVTACDSYTWLNGSTYASSISGPTWTLMDAFGCDSIITLDLTINNSSSGADLQTACASYVWLDGNTYISSTNTPTWNLINATGCDSVVTLDLTILSPSFSTDIQIACDTLVWLDGNIYTSNTNIPTWNLTNAAGCDSVITLNLTIELVDASATQLNDLTIEANTPGAQYQWLDCDSNFTIINGETGQLFTPLQNGNFAVQVTENGCIDTSACIAITNVGIIENDFGDSFVVYPNPTQESIHVSLGFEYNLVEIKFIDANGKIVQAESRNKVKYFDLSIEGSSGNYILEISSQGKQARIKIIKH